MFNKPFSFFLTLALLCAAPFSSNASDIAEALHRAYASQTHFPLAANDRPDLNLKEAYTIQKEFVDLLLKNDRIAGYKAGVTTPAAQESLGLSEALAGVLLESGVHPSGWTAPTTEFVAMKIETEVGFILAKPIRSKIRDAASLPEYIESVVPVIELPDAAFAPDQARRGVDVAAANVAAKAVIQGEPLPLNQVNVNAIQTRLTRQGEVVNTGLAEDAMGSPLKALQWLINNRLDHGWPVEPGQLLITGALGKVIPGEPGHYRADFGDLGKITFTIADPDSSKRWEKDIQAFETADRASPPSSKSIIFVGSSSIRGWKTLKQDFPEYSVFNRGFGGSEISDSIYFADRILIPHKPRGVVMYAGDNDINKGKSAETVRLDFKRFAEKIHQSLPEAKIGFIAVKPSHSRLDKMKTMRRANEMIREDCEKDPRLFYIDIFNPMLSSDGKPRKELFVEDQLHLNPKGYALWTEIVAKTLDEMF